MNDGVLIEAFWNQYRLSLPEDERLPAAPPEAWYFCDNEAAARELGDLVRAGIKTATCSLLWIYEAQGEKVPAAGDLSVIIDWLGNPLCLIETTEVTIHPYCEVDGLFAYDEGEGDRSLTYWREAHWRFFTRECAQIGRQPAEDMPLICERFRVLFRG